MYISINQSIDQCCEHFNHLPLLALMQRLVGTFRVFGKWQVLGIIEVNDDIVRCATRLGGCSTTLQVADNQRRSCETATQLMGREKKQSEKYKSINCIHELRNLKCIRKEFGALLLTSSWGNIKNQQFLFKFYEINEKFCSALYKQHVQNGNAEITVI